MANTSRINGFRPVKHVTGAPYNGQANVYAISSSNGTAVFVGDSVKLAADGNSDGYQFVTNHLAGTPGTGQAAVGVVVGIIPSKLDSITGKLTAGSTALDTPQYIAASTAGYVLVCDSPDVLYEVEATNAGTSYSFAVADIGQNCNVNAGAGSTTSGVSAYSADLNDKSTTATLPLKIWGVSQKVGNETTGAATKILVQINNHQYKGGTGTAGL